MRHYTWEECIESILGTLHILPRIILKIDLTIVLDNIKRGKLTWQPTSVIHTGALGSNWWKAFTAVMKSCVSTP